MHVCKLYIINVSMLERRLCMLLMYILLILNSGRRLCILVYLYIINMVILEKR